MALIASALIILELRAVIPSMLLLPPNPDFLRLRSFTVTHDAIATPHLVGGVGTSLCF